MTKVYVWKFTYISKRTMVNEVTTTFATSYPEPHRALEYAMMKYKDDLLAFWKFENSSTIEVV